MRADHGGRWDIRKDAEKEKKNKTQNWRQEERRKNDTEKEEGHKKTDIRKIKIGFWNVFGLKKNKQFWNYIEKFDIIGMVETFIEEKHWNELEKRILPENFIWKCQYAKRKKIKGRPMGGIITGVKKNIEENEEEVKRTMMEGVQVRRVTIGKDKWKIVTIYRHKKQRITEIIKEIKTLIAEDNEENLLIGGDFNARTGNKEPNIWKNNRDEIRRRSRDKKIDSEGRKLLEEIKERGWNILNGNITGDKEGEFTFKGPRGSSVIDYAIGNVEARGKIDKLVIKKRKESDHFPICVYIYTNSGHKVQIIRNHTTTGLPQKMNFEIP